MEDLGVLAVRNPAFFDFSVERKNPDGSLRPRHGFHTLPDGTLTPLHVVMATIVAHDGTIYATTIYPFTLLRIDKSPGGRGTRMQTNGASSFSSVVPIQERTSPSPTNPKDSAKRGANSGTCGP